MNKDDIAEVDLLWDVSQKSQKGFSLHKVYDIKGKHLVTVRKPLAELFKIPA